MVKINLEREPDKERYLTAIRHIESHEVPFWESEVDFEIVEKILGRKLPQTHSYFLPPKDYVEFTKVTGQDLIKLHVAWKPGRREVLERGIPIYAGGSIKDYEDIKKITHPGTDPIRRRIEEILYHLRDTKIGIAYSLYSTPNIVTDAMGYEEYYVALLERPEFIREFQKLVDEYVAQQLDTALEYPIVVVNTGFSLCMNTGPVVSQSIMEEFYFPYLRETVRKVHEKGVFLDYHCDGDYSSLYPKLIEMGVDSVNAIEPCGGRQNIYRLKALYGDRLAFKGNVDVGEVLTRGSQDDVRRDVVEHIEKLSIGGGYVCSSSHDISSKVPVENFVAMIEAIQSTPGVVRGAGDGDASNETI